MAGKAHRDHQAGDLRRSVDHRQRVRGQVAQPGPDRVDRRIGKCWNDGRECIDSQLDAAGCRRNRGAGRGRHPARPRQQTAGDPPTPIRLLPPGAVRVGNADDLVQHRFTRHRAQHGDHRYLHRTCKPSGCSSSLPKMPAASTTASRVHVRLGPHTGDHAIRGLDRHDPFANPQHGSCTLRRPHEAHDRSLRVGMAVTRAKRGGEHMRRYRRGHGPYLVWAIQEIDVQSGRLLFSFQVPDRCHFCRGSGQLQVAPAAVLGRSVHSLGQLGP